MFNNYGPFMLAYSEQCYSISSLSISTVIHGVNPPLSSADVMADDAFVTCVWRMNISSA